MKTYKCFSYRTPANLISSFKTHANVSHLKHKRKPSKQVFRLDCRGVIRDFLETICK